MEKPKTIMLFDNLNLAVFDAYGDQIPELQVSVSTLFAKHAEAMGWDVSNCIIETTSGNWKILKTDDGWNRQLQ